MNQCLGKRFPVLLLSTYTVALVVCGVLRILLKLRFMDTGTGFYLADASAGIIAVFNLGLLAAVLILFLSTRLRSTENDYPVPRRSRLAGCTCSLSGLALVAYVLLDEKIYPPMEQMLTVGMILGRNLLCLSLGVLSGFTLLWLGVGMLRGQQSRAAVLPALIPAIWQVFMLISRFNGFTVLTTITDNLLAVLFMLCASLFLIGQSRTLFGLASHTSRNYVIPAGLCMSLFGFVLVLPNAIYMLAHHQLEIPAPMLGFWEGVYVFLLSLHGLVFAVNTIRSIGQV